MSWHRFSIISQESAVNKMQVPRVNCLKIERVNNVMYVVPRVKCSFVSQLRFHRRISLGLAQEKSIQNQRSNSKSNITITRASRSNTGTFPKSVLATIIFLAVCKLVDVKDAMRTWRESKWDFVTLFCCVRGNVVCGCDGGNSSLAVISSLCVFIYYASRPRIVELRRIIGTVSYRAAEENVYNGASRVVKSENVYILRPEAPLYFGNIDVLLSRMDLECQKRFSLMGLGREKWVSLVLSFGCVGWIDSTAANALAKKFSHYVIDSD